MCKIRRVKRSATSDIAPEQAGKAMPVPGWRAESREFRVVLAVLLVACAIPLAGFIAQAVTATQPIYPDFFGLWSFGRFVISHAPATIYDDAALLPFQAGIGLTDASGFYPFPYPPWILLLLAPLAWLPFEPAMGVWLAASFAAFAGALTAWRWPRLLAGFLVLGPASGICFLVGQNGFLSAALMLGGLRLLRSRPLIGGALLAALGYKPQLAVLIPFVLLFGGHWRAMLGAGIAALCLSLVSTMIFGVEMWPAWLAAMRGQAESLSMGRDALLDMMPTVTAAALLLHGGASLARIAQLIAVMLALWAIWRVRGRGDADALAVVPLATMLATPYAFHYDLPMVSGAVLAVMATRQRYGTGELLLLLGCVVAPCLLVLRAGVASAIVPVLFAATLWGLAKAPREDVVF